MKFKCLVVFLVILGLFLFTQSAFAELKPATHKGLYLGFGIGIGSAGFNIDGSNIDFDRESGTSINLRIGGAINPNLLLGLEIDAWRKEENNAALQYNNYAASFTYYPDGRFFIKGGPALSIVVAEAFGLSDSESGTGFTLGTGVELRTGRKFAFVPSFQYIYQDLDGFSTNFYSFLLGFNWFW